MPDQPTRSNFDLKEEIRAYWSERAATFDLAFGHGIFTEAEFAAWQQPLRDFLGAEPLKVLELACGTGEVTRLIHDLGHEVTALDFSEAMLERARAKHAGRPRLRVLLADAGNTLEPDGAYDAIVCRHLVWTLTEPGAAFAEWFRVLKPGGRLVVYDGDWARPTWPGRAASFLIGILDRWKGPDRNYDPALGDRHAAIMRALPFGHGLRFDTLAAMLREAGFTDIAFRSHGPIARAQRKTADLRDRLRTRVYGRFILLARRSG